MSTIETTPTLEAPSSEKHGIVGLLQRSSASRLLLIGAVLLITLSATRAISGADDLTSSGTMGTTLRLTIPILMAGMAGLFAERSGIVNIGIEGMMIFGTWFGAYGAWQFGPWVGLLLGIIGGIIGGLIHAVATVRFNVDHIISGVAINLLAFGGMRYLSELAFVGEEGGGISQSPKQSAPIPVLNVPFLAGGEIFGWQSPDILGWLEDRQWFLIGDVAGILRGLVYNISWATIIALALVPLSAWFLWRTRVGLRVRSSGEEPDAAESLGVRIVRLRYLGLTISGAFAGLGGAYLSIVASSYYRQGQTAGRGYIGLATMIFGNWRPAGVLGGATLFGFAEALKLRREDSLIALFLFVSFVAGLIAILSLYRKRVITGVIAIVTAALFLLVYLTVEKVPASLTQATPYLVTLIVLATASQRLRPPAHAGKPWRPGSSH
jgi:general nucleoside transport system permease protein